MSLSLANEACNADFIHNHTLTETPSGDKPYNQWAVVGVLLLKVHEFKDYDITFNVNNLYT